MSVFCVLAVLHPAQVIGGTLISTWGQPFSCKPTGWCWSGWNYSSVGPQAITERTVFEEVGDAEILNKPQYEETQKTADFCLFSVTFRVFYEK